ncbi:cyclin-D5-1-like [Capsicum annuum]|uniref:cyclin-D5-1-like n=1 Tax=Capsicum annuum TaxID=4072 RepID=UPI001FB0D394|nr:cyclin-D5-1-like [Capsicum annuum]
MESSSSDEEEEQEVQQENGGGDDNDDDDDDANEMITYNIMDEIWEQEVRHRAILYIVTKGQQFGLRAQTLYKSVIYVDGFLAANRIDFEDYKEVRILSVACLSLAATMDESIENVPPLSRYPVGNLGINVNEIREMELRIRYEFNGDLHYVIPFDFIQFLLPRFARDVPSRYLTRMRIDEIIMSVLRGGRLINHRPSVIAAAATLLAVNRNLTIEQVGIHINALPLLNRPLQINNVWYCYNRLRELNEHI